MIRRVRRSVNLKDVRISKGAEGWRPPYIGSLPIKISCNLPSSTLMSLSGNLTTFPASLPAKSLRRSVKESASEEV